MINLSIGKYRLFLTYKELPALYAHYIRNASVVDEFELRNSQAEICFVGIGVNSDWPSLIVAQSYSPSEAGFNPGILIVPETQRLFIGAGTRLLLYDLENFKRLWQEEADLGFLVWRQHGDYVVMSAETELATWTTKGDKLWASYVEPPWGYEVENGHIKLDVMGAQSEFPINIGPS